MLVSRTGKIPVTESSISQRAQEKGSGEPGGCLCCSMHAYADRPHARRHAVQYRRVPGAQGCCRCKLRWDSQNVRHQPISSAANINAVNPGTCADSNACQHDRVSRVLSTIQGSLHCCQSVLQVNRSMTATLFSVSCKGTNHASQKENWGHRVPRCAHLSVDKTFAQIKDSRPTVGSGYRSYFKDRSCHACQEINFSM